MPLLPAPVPARLPAFLLITGLVPFFVRTPRALVAMCLWLPVVGAWTAQMDYLDRWTLGKRGRAVHGALLRAELEALGASDVSTFGHVHSALLLGGGLEFPGDEAARRPPTTRFLLRENELPRGSAGREEYAERVRVCIPGKVFVIEERTGR